MKNFDLTKRQTQTDKSGKLKHIRKSCVSGALGAKAAFTDGFLVFQCAALLAVYALYAYFFPVFLYVSLGLTALTAAYVLVGERDGQVKASWIFLLFLSCGCGYIIYFLASERVCYGYNKRKFAEIYRRTQHLTPQFNLVSASAAVENDCKYMYEAGGCATYQNTEIKYFSEARPFFDDMILRLEECESFAFFEFFIVSDGALLNRLLNVIRQKTARGVQIKFICDDAGCQGVLPERAKKRIKEAGAELLIFSKMFAPFNFGLNFRDHRKIVVIDGKTGYVGGCNIADACTNECKMDGEWKDAGVRIDGAAVDGLIVQFLRNRELITGEKLSFESFLHRYKIYENNSNVVPYAGGPEYGKPESGKPEYGVALCRGVYSSIISSANKRLYIMSPYFIPDGEMYSQIKLKAQSGVDVRLVLPSVPDYKFIYKVTKSNAERLIKYGVKVYYVNGTFLHSKVCLTENCATVGSVNFDMRAFYQELDNGIYSDDKAFLAAVEEDFNGVFAENTTAEQSKFSFFGSVITAVLKVFSPLM